MKTRLLIIIAIFLVLLPWTQGLSVGINNEVMVDGITISSAIVMIITLTFSLISWGLFSWASKNMSFSGVLLGIISGASLVVPFLQVLGPMAGVIVGIVAGFASLMLQKYMILSTATKPLIIAAATFVLTYVVLILLILQAQSGTTGIGVWTGTADGMVMGGKGFDIIFNNGVEFTFFLITIPSLIITGLIIRRKSL